MTSLDIVIVNWNSNQLLFDCLKSIVEADCSNFNLLRVVVVDNASSDDSLKGIEIFALPLNLILNSSNEGFSAACNQGAKESRADYILFLNPDTRLFKDSLSTSIGFMQRAENSKIGICGIKLVNSYNKTNRSCTRYPNFYYLIWKSVGLSAVLPSVFKSFPMTDWDHENSQYVDHVIGAFFLVRHTLFYKLEGFDETFFVYLEDLDFSYRASKIGFTSYYLAETSAFHKEGGSSEQVKPHRLFYSLHSKIKYGYKHFGWLKGTLLLSFVLLAEPFSRIVLSILRLSYPETRDTIIAYRMLIQKLVVDSLIFRKT